MKKRNFIAKELLSKKFSQKKIKPKKGKGSFKRKTKVLRQSAE
jgi:alternative ribosome-rescue factor